jgi:hypothetical protein
MFFNISHVAAFLNEVQQMHCFAGTCGMTIFDWVLRKFRIVNTVPKRL